MAKRPQEPLGSLKTSTPQGRRYWPVLAGSNWRARSDVQKGRSLDPTRTHCRGGSWTPRITSKGLSIDTPLGLKELTAKSRVAGPLYWPSCSDLATHQKNSVKTALVVLEAICGSGHTFASGH